MLNYFCLALSLIVKPHVSCDRFLNKDFYNRRPCFVVFCAEILQLSPTFVKRLLTSCEFLSHGETLHCENKIDKEF